MDEEVWCSLDLQQLPSANDVTGLHGGGAAENDPFWPALADCTASFLAGDDIHITGPPPARGEAAKEMDTSYFAADEHQDLLPMTQQERTYSSSPSSKRSISMDDTTSFGLTAFDPFAGDDVAIVRAMMAVLSSASPSSSESSSPPQSNETTTQQAADVYPRSSNNSGLVTARSITSSLFEAPEKTAASLSNSVEDRAAAGSGNNNSSQVYHMISERKRREKLNDTFQTLRSLLPPCSKKDKTTVLINAASYLKKLEAEVSELEEKNGKLERHVPREDGGAAAGAAAHRRAKVQLSRASDQVNLTVMVMVECDIVDLVLHVLERLRWMAGVSVLSVDADTYSPQVLLKAIASIKLQITDGACWNEASFREAMKKVVHDATSSPSAFARLVAAA